MSGFFLDTSALVKIYHREAGTDFLLGLYHGRDSLLISELTQVELRSTVFRKFRERRLDAQALDAVLRRFSWDCLQRFKVLPVVSLVFDAACGLLNLHGRERGLRTLDSIQLATFLNYRETDRDNFVVRTQGFSHWPSK